MKHLRRGRGLLAFGATGIAVSVGFAVAVNSTHLQRILYDAVDRSLMAVAVIQYRLQGTQEESTLPVEKFRSRYVKYIRQKRSDCVQTCLDMLRYPGHEKFGYGGMYQEQLMGLEGLHRIDIIPENTNLSREEFRAEKRRLADMLDYSIPHILRVMMKDGKHKSSRERSGHAVIREKNETGDWILCPELGIFPANEYLDKFVDVINNAYRVEPRERN